MEKELGKAAWQGVAYQGETAQQESGAQGEGVGCVHLRLSISTTSARRCSSIGSLTAPFA